MLIIESKKASINTHGPITYPFSALCSITGKPILPIFQEARPFYLFKFPCFYFKHSKPSWCTTTKEPFC